MKAHIDDKTACGSESDVRILINHTTRPEVLMIRSSKGWELPRVKIPERINSFSEYLNQRIKDQLGCSTTLLYRIGTRVFSEIEQSVVFLVMENHSPEWMPSGAIRWVGCDSLRQITIGDLAQKDVIETYFSEAFDKAAIAHRADWQRVGWLSEALQWISERLECHGIRVTGKYRQIASTSLHFLIEVSTSVGNFYLKGVRDCVTHEQSLTCELAEQFPIHFPSIIAIDEARHWWLMKDVGGRQLDQVSDIKRWEDVFRSLARIQIGYASRSDRLLTFGCPDYRLHTLASKIDSFFTLISEREARHSLEFIGSASINRPALAQRLRELCGRLERYKMPDSVGHGDLNFGNIRVTDNNCIFLDWATGYAGHPLFSLAGFLTYIEGKPGDMKSARDGLRSAYLAPWLGDWSLDTLMKAYYISRPLEALRYAMDIAKDSFTKANTNDAEEISSIKVLNSLIGWIHGAAYSTRILGS
jgi:hypothetical protein